MKVFISHALKDTELLQKFKETLEPQGLQLHIAEHYSDIERTVTEKIENMIRQSDVAMILLTQNGINSHFVQQEIGYIKAQNIPFVQVIELGLEGSIKGFNYGRDYVLLDPVDPTKAMEKVKRILLNLWNKKIEDQANLEMVTYQAFENRRRMIELQQIEAKRKQDEANAKLLVGGLAAVLIIGLLTSQS